MELKKFTFDIRWVGVGFCFFVTLHLFPGYLMYQLRNIFPAFSVIYTGWMFGGTAFVGFLIGYRSRGVTVLEAAAAAILYSLVFLAAVDVMWGTPVKMYVTFWIYTIFAIATLSAALGEVVQAMKEKRKEATK